MQIVFLSTQAASTGSPVREKVRKTRVVKGGKKTVQNAIYAHIRAVRALGRTQVTVEEVARNLGLATSEVQGALTSLRSKGVRMLPRS